MAKEEKGHTAIVHIYSTFNNTIAQVTDLAGNTIAKISGGQVTKHNRLKANPTIGMFIAKKLKEMVKDYNITSFYVRIKGQTGSSGYGPGANAIARTLTKEGLRVISILDITKVARGGPKKKGGRRGRRV
jgi:small subunit ribosomal protein S11